MEMPRGFIAAMARHANEPIVDLTTPTAVENGLAFPSVSVVDPRALTRCRMLSIALCQVAAECRLSALYRMLALCQRVGNIPKGRQYTKVGHSMTTPMRQTFGLTMATPMGQCLVLP